MATENERLLDAEEAVHMLLGDLERLKKEIAGYALATSTLTAAHGQLSGLAAKLTEMVEQTRSVIETMGRIGTAEILAQLEAMRTLNQQVAQACDGLVQSVQGASRSAEAAADVAQKAHGDLTSMLSTLERRIKTLTLLVGIGLPCAALVMVAVILFTRASGG